MYNIIQGFKNNNITKTIIRFKKKIKKHVKPQTNFKSIASINDDLLNYIKAKQSTINPILQLEWCL